MISETFSPSLTLNNPSASTHPIDPPSPPARTVSTEPAPPDFWRQAREQMLLDPQVANLNTGLVWPTPAASL